MNEQAQGRAKAGIVEPLAGVVQRWVAQRAAKHGFALNAPQLRVLSHFERLHRELAARERLDTSFMRLLRRKPPVAGIYLWGGVGRGKSFLMDSFYEIAPVKRKRRVHFHRFMLSIHRALNRHQGTADPSMAVARELAQRSRLICLDEFHITDITDAMLMRRLLEGLIANDVVIVTTSNEHPDKLYSHGLQRTQFLPAIELIKQQLEVVHAEGATDFRLRELERAGVYHTCGESEALLKHAFRTLADHQTTHRSALEIEGRRIEARRHANGVAWFDFNALCDGPRGKADYIELARRYHTVLISDIPHFSPAVADVARRFTWLIDEFYDRRVKLIVSAAALPGQLYAHDKAAADFQRTVSRMIEMQTRDYLTQPHLP